MSCLVQLAQKTTVWLMNKNFKRLVERSAEGENGYHDHHYIQRSLTRFLRYLERNFKEHFDFNSPMPRSLWIPIRKLVQEAIIPHENSCLKEVDEMLVALLNKECSSMLGKQAPIFAKGYYWEKLADAIKSTTPVNDPTLQTIYTLISCNFNSDAFAKYVISYYGKELIPGEDATDFWKAHLVELGRIQLRHDMVLHSQVPFSCIEMLIACINNEIQAFVYTGNANRLIAAPITLKTPMSASLLSLYYRIHVETQMLEEGNVMELMKKVALLYQTPGGSLSFYHLQNKFYSPERHAILKMKTYLSRMMNRLNEIEKEKPKTEGF